MLGGPMKLRLSVPWINTMEEKRILVKHISDRIKHRFPVSVVEVAEHYTTNIIVLGIACVEGYPGMSEEKLDRILLYIQENTDAEFIDMRREMLSCNE